jgi:hypothetical protein
MLVELAKLLFERFSQEVSRIYFQGANVRTKMIFWSEWRDIQSYAYWNPAQRR